MRTIRFDRVDDVSSHVKLVGRTIDNQKRKIKTGVLEFSMPLSVLGLSPKHGMTIRGDVGILRGIDFQTRQRIYWHNKATGLVSDLPSEAELLPHLWGQWTFRVK